MSRKGYSKFDQTQFKFQEDCEAACAPPRRLLAYSHPRKSTPGVVCLASVSASSGIRLTSLGEFHRGNNTTAHRYVWDGHRLRAWDIEDIELANALLQPGNDTPARKLAFSVKCLANHATTLKRSLYRSFFPNPATVSEDYWENAFWRAAHRLFSSMSSIFATQSLLQAVGIGAKKSLPAAATINWVLKDGLGKIGRLTVATRFGESFDADLKRFRFATSLLYAVAITMEYLTPRFPEHFLILASLANVGKSVGLATFIATQPAFHRSFAKTENLADISAKAQAQQMMMDNLGLAFSVAATHAVRHNESLRRALPLTLLPVLVFGDLFCIYKELKSVHLRTLNRERTEIILRNWLDRCVVLTPKQVSEAEYFVLPESWMQGTMPLSICSLEKCVRNADDVERLNARSRYVITTTTAGLNGEDMKRKGDVRVALRDDAASEDIVRAMLQAAYIQRGSSLKESEVKANRDAHQCIQELEGAGWQTSPFMLSSTEQRRYTAFK